MYNMYPLMFNLQNKVVVIIGGGKIAYRKASGLKDTGAFVTVVSPEICEEMKELSYITWKQKLLVMMILKMLTLFMRYKSTRCKYDGQTGRS